MMPGPQQRAMVAALEDDAHVAEQHARYAARRATLRAALEAAGFRIDHSEASLYLWAHAATRTAGTPWPGWPSAASWSRPASFYGRAGERHVRVAFTATDERVAAAAAASAADRPQPISTTRRVAEPSEPLVQPSSESRPVRQRLPS